LPIIALTAGNVKGEREKCLEAGMDDFVVKPIVEQTLAAIFDKWLNNNTNYHEILPNNAEYTKAHFDISKLVSYLGNDDKAIREILKMVKTELADALQNLDRQIATQNVKGINSVGHKLYGTASSTGLETLALLAADMERLTSIEEGNTNAVRDKIKAEIVTVIMLIDNY
jgi:HPt (histidine-containing phosphotransfer) domain-containing protein